LIVVDRAKIAEADYNLSPSRWVGQSSSAEVGCVSALVRELSALDNDAHQLSATISKMLAGVVDEPA
ncbi:MAG: hypothetical protein ACK4S3_06640, partial [Parvibaculum sp.]